VPLADPHDDRAVDVTGESIVHCAFAMAARVIEVSAENDRVLDAGLQARQLRVEPLVFIHHVGGRLRPGLVRRRVGGGGLHLAV
jgi:hypothetical protein